MSTPSVWYGVVQAAQANFYRVGVTNPVGSDPSRPRREQSGQVILCTCRTRLKKMGYQVMVGDHVQFVLGGEASASDASAQRGAIIAVEPRSSLLSRPAIANLDQVMVVFALAEPELDPYRLSRFLVQAETTGLPVQLCLNKCDLLSQAAQQAWVERLRRWGYDPLLVSARTGEGLAELLRVCTDQISVLMGLSGVGKSSLLNRLVPDLDLPTQTVSGRLQQGRHTTRHVELFPLQVASGWVADSPGFNQVERYHCASQDLIQYFPEARDRAGGCQFRNCLHQQEPGCQVNREDWERYPWYLDGLAELLQIEERASRRKDEAHIKYKSTGKQERMQAIPRLQGQHKLSSRRVGRQQPLEDA